MFVNLNKIAHKTILSIATIILFLGDAMAAHAESPLEISCLLKCDTNYAGAPVLVDVVVSNSSDRTVNVFAYEGRPLGVGFKLRFETERHRKRIPRVGSYISTELPIPPKSEKKFTYCANKYVSLNSVGQYALNYDISVGYCSEDEKIDQPQRSAEVKGVLGIELNKSNPTKLNEILKMETGRLDTKDQRVINEVAEAVCYLDDPITLEYIGSLIDTGNVRAQQMALDALYRFDNERSTVLLLELLNPCGDRNIVEVALWILTERKVRLEKSVIKKLLESKDNRIRRDALKYLEKLQLSVKGSVPNGTKLRAYAMVSSNKTGAFMQHLNFPHLRVTHQRNPFLNIT